MMWKSAKSEDSPIKTAGMLTLFRQVCRAWRNEFSNEFEWSQLYENMFAPRNLLHFKRKVDFAEYMTSTLEDDDPWLYEDKPDEELGESNTAFQWRQRFVKIFRRSGRRAFCDRLKNRCSDCKFCCKPDWRAMRLARHECYELDPIKCYYPVGGSC